MTRSKRTTFLARAAVVPLAALTFAGFAACWRGSGLCALGSARSVACADGHLAALRVAALRAAFMAMTSDPVFRAEAAKMQLDVSPTPGQAVQEFVVRMYSSPKPVVERAKDAIRPN